MATPKLQTQVVGILRKSQAQQMRDRQQKQVLGVASDLLEMGTCIVVTSVRNGDGCVADCTIMGNGKSAGLRIQAVCHSAFLKPGVITHYRRTASGMTELFGGGGSGDATATTSEIQLIPLHDHSDEKSGGPSAQGQLHGGL